MTDHAESTPSEVEALERKIAILTRKLARSERNRARTEDMAGKNQRMLEATIEDLESTQDELRRSNAELEDRVARRTRELREARDAAVSASQAKSVFLANMSHELRTPLNAIIGYSELIREDLEFEFEGSDQTPPAVGDLAKIRTAGRHLLSVINNILNLSKIEAGRMEVDASRFAVNSVVEESAHTVAHQVEKSRSELVCEVDEGLGDLVSDHTKLRQCLINLLNNAAKFTEDGQVHLRASGFERDDRQWVRFEVEDTGIGIPEEKQQRLFEMFTQADASTTRQFGGTGLGLTITRHFCELLGGSIGVRSQEGVGTTFTIEIPAVYEGAVEAHLEDEASPGKPSAGSGPRAGRLLLVDDDTTVHDLLDRYLRDSGFEIVGLSDGDHVLEAARKLAPDVIVLDVMMPQKDGWQVLSELKADPELGSTPVVMHSIVSERGRGLRMGAAEYITKPVERGELLAVLDRYLDDASELTVMVVEDDEATRDVVTRIVESQGWKAVAAANGADALDALEQTRPDMILLDLMMPEMDGYEFADRIHSDPSLRDIPVTVLTAADLSAEQRRQLKGQVTAVLAKDIDQRDRIVEQIRLAVEQARATPGATG